MPYTPDFDQIARTYLARLDVSEIGDESRASAELADQLRLVWNARGDADIGALEATPVATLHAIRALNR